MRAQSNITFQYVYDDLGQLIKVIDSSGNEIDYVYDAVGNIVQITRGTAPAAGSLAIFNFTPQRGNVASTVTVQGQGFSPTPGANTVQFNGTQATVTSASGSTLVVTVPNGATTGPISVTVGATTVMTAGNFTVVPAPVITSLSRKSALFNTVVPNLVVTGSNLTGATFSFGTPITITSASIAASGTSATLSLTTGSTPGTFGLIATNAFGPSGFGVTKANRFTVVDPKSTAISASGVPDVVEASFGLDPLDPNSVPNTSFPPSGEVDPLVFSVLNRGGAAPGQPVSMEADALVFSALNLAGVTGGQPMKVEGDALVFSVLNTAGSGGTGQAVKVEADAVPTSVLNLAGVSGNQPMQMEADGVPFSVNNTATGAPAAAKPAVSPQASNSPPVDTSPRKTNAVRSGAPQAKAKPSDLKNTKSTKPADSQDSDKTRREP